MSPLLTGVLASQISGHLNTFTLTGAYDALATVTVPSGGASSITFSAIPQTGYSHLQIRGFVQTNRGTYGIDEGFLTFNGDTSSNYADHYLYGEGANPVAAGADTSKTKITIGTGTFGTSTGGTFGAIIMDLLDYSNLNKNKTIRTLGGVDVNGTVGGIGGRISLSSGLWMNNSTGINSLTITPSNGSLFSQFSQFSLFGIK